MKEKETMKKIGTWTLACGLLSTVFYVLHDVIGAMHYPGYDWMRQAVSDLTAADAPSFAIASGFSAVYGIFSCMCCAFLCVLSLNSGKCLKHGICLYTAMQFVSAVGYSLFPLTGSGYDGSVQSFMHVWIVTAAVVLLSVASLILIAAGAFREKRKALGSLAAAALAFMCIGAAGSGAAPREIFGIVERFSTYSAVLFTGVLGVWGYITAKNEVSSEKSL